MPEQNKSGEDKDAVIKDLRRDLLESRAETAACLRFLSTELSWENFRADTLYFKEADTERRNASESNALRLKEYLQQRGHGIKLLARLEELERMQWP